MFIVLIIYYMDDILYEIIILISRREQGRSNKSYCHFLLCTCNDRPAADVLPERDF